jgi:hypothetical protein
MKWCVIKAYKIVSIIIMNNFTSALGDTVVKIITQSHYYTYTCNLQASSDPLPVREWFSSRVGWRVAGTNKLYPLKGDPGLVWGTVETTMLNYLTKEWDHSLRAWRNEMERSYVHQTLQHYCSNTIEQVAPKMLKCSETKNSGIKKNDKILRRCGA